MSEYRGARVRARYEPVRPKGLGWSVGRSYSPISFRTLIYVLYFLSRKNFYWYNEDENDIMSSRKRLYMEKEMIFNPRFGEVYMVEEITTSDRYELRPEFCWECGSFEGVFKVTLIKNGRPDKRYSRYLGAGEVDDEFPSDTCIFYRVDRNGHPVV